MAHLQFLPSSNTFAQSLRNQGGGWGLAGLKIKFLLQKYEGLPSTNLQARIQTLDEVLDWLTNASRAQPLFAPIQLTTAALAKEYHLMGIASTAWANARTLFGRDGGTGSSRKTFGLTSGGNQLTVKDVHRNNATQSTNHTMQLNGASRNYQLEMMDPKHRCWGLLNKADTLFQRWAEANTMLNFFDWAESLPPTDADSGGISSLGKVAYLNPSQRAQLEVFPANGLIRKPHSSNPSQGAPHSTKGFETVFSGKTFGIFVMSQSLQIYSGSHYEQSFHHSSFLSGARVICAGEWAVSNGHPLYISHKTGHYKADAASLRRLLLRLASRGIDLTKTVVAAQSFVATGVHTRHVQAMEFLSKGCDASKCTNLNDDFVTKAAVFNATQVEDGIEQFVKTMVKPYVQDKMKSSATSLF